MPDIQTEMQKIMQAWEHPYPLTETTQQSQDTHMFTKTSGVSEKTFNIVRDQPGMPKAECIRKLELIGVKKASSSSLLSQMIKQGHIWVDSSGGLRPNQKEYTPIKAASTYVKKVKQAKTSKVRTVPEGIAALVKEHVEKDRVQEIMNTLSLPDAKRLYNSLATYFGTV